MDRTSLLRQARRGMVFAAAAVAILSAVLPAARGGEEEKIRWESVDGAQVKIDEKIPLTWNVYQPSKKDKKKYGSLVLILLGHRYLAFDMKTKLVYEVQTGDLQKDGDDFESGDLREIGKQIPSIDWSLRDVGPEELVQATLEDYGRRVSVSIPHPPDLRAFY